MPEQPEGGQKKELNPLIKEYFTLRHLELNQIPQHSYDALANFPDQHAKVLVDVLNAVGKALEDDTRSLDEIGESLESGAPMTPLEMYHFMIH